MVRTSRIESFFHVVVSKAASWWGLEGPHPVGMNHGRGCDFVLKVPGVVEGCKPRRVGRDLNPWDLSTGRWKRRRGELGALEEPRVQIPGSGRGGRGTTGVGKECTCPARLAQMWCRHPPGPPLKLPWASLLSPSSLYQSPARPLGSPQTTSWHWLL